MINKINKIYDLDGILIVDIGIVGLWPFDLLFLLTVGGRGSSETYVH